jgi:hypothetical protein
MAQEPAEVVFEAWKSPTGETFRCYVFPVTAGEQDAIWRARAEGGLSSLFEVIVQRAKRRDGSRIFSTAHKVTFRHECLSTEIIELATEINDANPPPAQNQEAIVKP